MNFHLLFEQSGTFKNVLKNHGHNAFDYDILNDYGETDYQIDIFEEIEKEYKRLGDEHLERESIFSHLDKNKDFIIAFFPCTHFCDANQLQYRLWNVGKKLEFDKRSCDRLIERNKDRARYFELWLKFCLICKERGIPTIIENPASSGTGNYLVQFSPIEVAYCEKDRTLFGDNFKKPTNFFAINFEMKENFMMFDKNYGKISVYKKFGMTWRSTISERYVENFYIRFLQKLENKGEK